jgi:hypothetical protein
VSQGRGRSCSHDYSSGRKRPHPSPPHVPHGSLGSMPVPKQLVHSDWTRTCQAGPSGRMTARYDKLSGSRGSRSRKIANGRAGNLVASQRPVRTSTTASWPPCTTPAIPETTSRASQLNGMSSWSRTSPGRSWTQLKKRSRAARASCTTDAVVGVMSNLPSSIPEGRCQTILAPTRKRWPLRRSPAAEISNAIAAIGALAAPLGARNVAVFMMASRRFSSSAARCCGDRVAPAGSFSISRVLNTTSSFGQYSLRSANPAWRHISSSSRIDPSSTSPKATSLPSTTPP